MDPKSPLARIAEPLPQPDVAPVTPARTSPLWKDAIPLDDPEDAARRLGRERALALKPQFMRPDGSVDSAAYGQAIVNQRENARRELGLADVVHTETPDVQPLHRVASAGALGRLQQLGGLIDPAKRQSAAEIAAVAKEGRGFVGDLVYGAGGMAIDAPLMLAGGGGGSMLATTLGAGSKVAAGAALGGAVLPLATAGGVETYRDSRDAGMGVGASAANAAASGVIDTAAGAAPGLRGVLAPLSEGAKRTVMQAIGGVAFDTAAGVAGEGLQAERERMTTAPDATADQTLERMALAAVLEAGAGGVGEAAAVAGSRRAAQEAAAVDAMRAHEADAREAAMLDLRTRLDAQGETQTDLTPIPEPVDPAWVPPPGWTPQAGSPRRIEAPGDVLQREDTPADLAAHAADLEKRTPVAKALMEKRRAEISGDSDPFATIAEAEPVTAPDPYEAATMPPDGPRRVLGEQGSIAQAARAKQNANANAESRLAAVASEESQRTPTVVDDLEVIQAAAAKTEQKKAELRRWAIDFINESRPEGDKIPQEAEATPAGMGRFPEVDARGYSTKPQPKPVAPPTRDPMAEQARLRAEETPDADAAAPAPQVAPVGAPAARPMAPARVEPSPRPEATTAVSPAPSGAPRLTAIDLRKQLESLPISRRTPGLVDANMAIVEARAKSAGLSADEWVGRRIARVQEAVDGASLNQSALMQDTLSDARMGDAGKSTKKGAVQFLSDGRAVIHAFEQADASTVLHEIGHVFRRDIEGPDLAPLEKWAHVRDGKWTRRAEEQFARGFERYMRDGQAPTKELQSVFQRFASWLRNVYAAIRGGPIDVKVSPEVRRVFDRLLTPGAMPAANAKPESVDAPAKAEPASVAPPEPAPARPAAVADKAPTSSPASPDAPRETGKADSKADVKRPALGVDAGLANPGRSADVRRVVDEARAKIVPPPVRSWDQEYKSAEAIIADDVQRKALMDKVKAGEPLSASETAAYDLVLNGSETRAKLESGDANALLDVVRGVVGYTAGGSELARAMAIRRDKTMSPNERRAHVLHRAIALPSSAEMVRIAAIKAKMEKAEPAERARLQASMDRITAVHAQRIVKFRERMKQQGIDLTKLDELYQSEEKSALVVREAAIEKADPWDALYEWWISSILSGPKTQVVNATGSAMNFLSHYGIEKPLQSVLGKMVGKESGPSFNELKHVYGAALSGSTWKSAGRNFLKAWSAERPVLEAELRAGRQLSAAEVVTRSEDKSASDHIQHHAPVMKGRAAKVLRSLSIRAIQAVDEFAKSLGARMEVGAQAYRRGKQAGFADGSPELAEFMRSELEDMSSGSWEAAFTTAKELTFQADAGKITEKVISLRNAVPGARYIVPFIPTLVNLLGRGLTLAPVSAQINMAQRMARHGLWMAKPNIAGALPYTRSEIVKHLAASIAGLAMIGSFEALTDDDPNTGAFGITGSEGRYTVGKDQVRREVAPPKSIRIGNTWLSYGRLDPFATPLSVYADLRDELSRGPDADLMKRAGSTMTGLVVDKSFMQALSDITSAVSTNGLGWNAAASSARGILTGFVPNVLRQPLGATNDTVRSQSVMSEAGPANADWWSEQARVLVGQALAGYTLPPKVDKWGREVEKDSYNFASDFLLRLLSPVDTMHKTPMAYDVALHNWNKTATKPEWPGLPRTYFEDADKRRFYMTPDDYQAYLKERGAKALEFLNGFKVADPVHPKKWEIDRIKSALTRATRVTKPKYMAKARANGDKAPDDE